MLDLLKNFFDIVLHIDWYVEHWALIYHVWVYLFMFIIIFCETGLVVTPFLPGDSLIFAAGAVAAMPSNPLNIFFLIPLLFFAAFSGDNSNFFIGKFLGSKVYEKDYKLIKREYLTRTHAFYERHGGSTLIIARFIPIIRTFAPFVAGVGTMRYLRFFLFSILGNILWVNLFSWGGFFFGNIPIIRKNFSLVIIAIIFVSLLPVIIGAIKKMTERNVEKEI
ncbi:MAG: DedA family protein [Bacteroidota bacterium]|nr:DedA family protein [Bacteroidota bacterium]